MVFFHEGWSFCQLLEGVLASICIPSLPTSRMGNLCLWRSIEQSSYPYVSISRFPNLVIQISNSEITASHFLRSWLHHRISSLRVALVSCRSLHSSVSSLPATLAVMFPTWSLQSSFFARAVSFILSSVYYHLSLDLSSPPSAVSSSPARARNICTGLQ